MSCACVIWEVQLSTDNKTNTFQHGFLLASNLGGDEGLPAPGESQLETEWDWSCKSEEYKVEKGCSGQCLRGIDHNLHWKSRLKNED